jgi:RNA polymerase sigma-70 factor (ECF subfamily)
MEGIQGLALDLRQSLEQLPAADREMFLMKEVGGLTYQEIAQVCDSSIEGVRSRLHRARTALRVLMSSTASNRNPGTKL